MLLAKDKEYLNLLDEIKARVKSAQIKAVISVNKELVQLYWDIGQNILARQAKEGWGTKVIDRLSLDLTNSFPEMKGFSPRNLKYMRTLAEEYPDKAIVQGVLAQLTWYHNITLLEKVGSFSERLWYAQHTIKNGWSRNILVHQIESNLYNRQGKITPNFGNTLPAPQSDLARQTLKDPYIFDFLSLGEEAQEREIERELTKHITQFLLELGAGFSFVGSQYPLEVSGQDYYIDLLFYHLRLRCYVIIELKAGEFKPEYAGKLNFYLSAVDKILKEEEDKPSIGIILCKSKDKVIAEYALKDMSKLMGVSRYKIARAIPEKLKISLPTIDELEEELSRPDRNKSKPVRRKNK